jgi:hypothetical protein
MTGRAVTTPKPQGDLGLDQKSACRKNQNNVLAYEVNLRRRALNPPLFSFLNPRLPHLVVLGRVLGHRNVGGRRI